MSISSTVVMEAPTASAPCLTEGIVSSGMSSSSIQCVKRYLCVKKLTVHDGFTAKSVKLPRAEARFFMGELRNRQATPVVLLDEQGNCWELLCTCFGGQYALSRIGAFCETHGVSPGCYFIFYADHDHIVRLAVRQQLPEDVQAALAAARAALAARVEACQQPQSPGSPQPPPPQEPPSPAAARPAAAPQPGVLDDPSVLEEMPPLSTAVNPPAACNQVAPGSSTRAALPLQDRSNLQGNAAAVVAEAAEASRAPKCRPLGPKNGTAGNPSGPGVSGSAAQAAALPKDCNKENDPGAMPLPAAGKAHAPAPPPPATSTGGLSLLPSPGNRQHHQLPASQLSPKPQAQAPRPAPPAASPSPQPARQALVQQPQPSPATRLRLRFEARLRALAGRPHPLSVRSGPETPLPLSPGQCSDMDLACFWAPGSLAGPHQTRVGFGSGLGLGGPGFFPPPWTAAGGWASHAPGAGFREMGRPGLGSLGCRAQTEHAAATAGATTVGARTNAAGVAGAGPSDSWRQELQCDEMLDWEVGRRATDPEGEEADASAGPGRPCQREHGPHGGSGGGDGFQLGRVQPPHYPASTTAAAGPSPPVGLAALHHMLRSNEVVFPMGLGRPGPGQHHLGSLGAFNSGPHAPQSPSAAAAAWGLQRPTTGALASLAASSSGLCQILSMGAAAATTTVSAASAAAWNLAAMAGRVAGGWDCPQGGGGSGWASPGPSREAAAQGAHTGGGGEVFGSRVFEARAKSSLSVGRPSLGSPAELPCGKRQRAQEHAAAGTAAATGGAKAAAGVTTSPHQQHQLAAAAAGAQGQPQQNMPAGPAIWHPAPGSQLASKSLTAHELLTGHVTLTLNPDVCTCLAARTSPTADGLEPGVGSSMAAAAGEGTAGERGSEAMEVDVSPLTAAAPPAGAGAMAGNRPGSEDPSQKEDLGTALQEPEQHQQRQEEGGQPGCECEGKVPVDVVVETGAVYEGVLLLSPGPRTAVGSSRDGGARRRECELRGLRPYLIRRESGVGDVLVIWVEDAEGVESRTRRLRLRAALQQRR